jgi:hypothetical protein
MVYDAYYAVVVLSHSRVGQVQEAEENPDHHQYFQYVYDHAILFSQSG